MTPPEQVYPKPSFFPSLCFFSLFLHFLPSWTHTDRSLLWPTNIPKSPFHSSRLSARHTWANKVKCFYQEKLFHSASALLHFSPSFTPLNSLLFSPWGPKNCPVLNFSQTPERHHIHHSPPLLLFPNSSLASSLRALSHRAFDSSLLPPFLPHTGFSREVLYSPVIPARAVKNTSGITL